MIKKSNGFTLIELLITMIIFVLAIAAASQLLTGVLTQFKQQSKIAETNIEGVLGLELLRYDIEHAGLGLPWNIDIDSDGSVDPWNNITAYCEAQSVAATAVFPNPADFNDGNNNGACGIAVLGGNAPRGILAANGNLITGLNTSDYLVIKSSYVSASNAVYGITEIRDTGASYEYASTSSVMGDLPEIGTRVIVLAPVLGPNSKNVLRINPGTSINNPGRFFATFDTNAVTFGGNYPDLLPPHNTGSHYFVFGVDPNTNLRMPFNRADYYITKTNTPAHCAAGPTATTGTGVLVKDVISQAAGARGGPMPLLDCVADMQITFRADIDSNGVLESYDAGGLASLTAAEIRTIKEVRIYILAHEGQRDPNYTFNNFTGTCATCVLVGNNDLGDGAAFTHDFNLSTITDFLNYRWKVYTLFLTPYNLDPSRSR